tara:strand:+ start:585 stop:1271 length:687 start_codon:yes stop_codon:yes gene_type:complete
MAKRRRKTTYFTKVHEQAIIDFNNTTDLDEREYLYSTYIGPVFSEMVDKIVFTYRFTTLPNIDSLRDECKIWLTTVLQKYDPSKGSKAFSYFSVITKNWFIAKVKKNSKAKRIEVSISDVMMKPILDEKLVVSHGYYAKRAEREFWRELWTEMESWDTGNLKPNERKVLEAIKILLDNPDSIEIFNKKAIYLYIREITGLNTKQIVNNLNKMRAKYRTFKKDWNEGKR